MTHTHTHTHTPLAGEEGVDSSGGQRDSSSACVTAAFTACALADGSEALAEGPSPKKRGMCCVLSELKSSVFFTVSLSHTGRSPS